MNKETEKTNRNQEDKDYTQCARENFANDKFATIRTNIVIEEAKVDYARCSFDIEDEHLNANNTVMGGAIFTLADFVFAIASNTGKARTVSQNSRIDFIGVAKGKKLIAESECVKSGKGTCLFDIVVKDELGTLVAKVTSAGYRMSK